jgi:hypothetical protein
VNANTLSLAATAARPVRSFLLRVIVAPATKRGLPVAFQDRWRAARRVATRHVTSNNVIAIATTVYAVLSLLMWMELRNSNEGAQRAWVVIRTDGVTGLLAAPSATFEVGLENAGKSPAQQVRGASTSATSAMLDFPNEPPFNVDVNERTRESVFVLGPGLRTQLQVHATLTPAAVADVYAGRLYFYLYGRLTYSDQFSSHRETRWCLRFVPADHTFASCGHHNRVR